VNAVQGLVIIASLLRADDAGHGSPSKEYDYREFTPEQRERIDYLFRRVMCACPRENWTRTLAGCPDDCADAQKAQVRAAVKRGLSNEEVLAEQVKRYDTEEVLSLPPSNLAHLVPYAALAALAVVVVGLLVRAVRPAGGPAPSGAATAATPDARSEEEKRLDAAVEKDLAEMEE